MTVLKPFPPMRIFTTIDEILTEVAAGDDVRRYFEARGLRTVGTLALVAASEEMFTRHVCDPLLNGYTVGTDRITVAESEKPIVRAVLLHACSLAKVSWSRSMTPAPTPTPSAPTVTATTTTGSPNNETKVPKSLPPGKWAELVNAYQNVTLNGRPRHFPLREILGAEPVVARLWHERHVSKMYTPLQLGELLQHRSFSASGEINPLSKGSKKSTSLSLDEDRQLVENEDPTWTPRSVLSVTDGLQAARWAYVLVQMGEEEEIMHFIDQMQMRARSRTDKMEQFVMYWHASMWRVAMDMRSGDSFGAATKKILDDMAFYHDHMMKDIASPKSKLKPPPRTDVTDRFIKPGKGGKAGKGSGQDRQGDRYTPYPSPRWQSQSSWRSGGGNAWQGRNYQQNQWREQNHSSCYMSDPRNRDSSGPRLMALLRYPAFGRRPSTVFHRLSRAISAFCCPFSQEWKWRHKQSMISLGPLCYTSHGRWTPSAARLSLHISHRPNTEGTC